jgi:hypothetical protein
LHQQCDGDVRTSQIVWGVRQLRKDNEILKMKVEIFTMAERLAVSYVLESLTRLDMTSSVSTKNSAVKTYEDALSAGCDLLPKDPSVSADFVLSAMNG